MGTAHAQYISQNAVAGATLAAVCDTNPQRLAWAEQNLGAQVQTFGDVDELLASNSVDGVLIATPHYNHPTTAIKAFEHGLHVLIEKPAGVYTKQVREMNEAAAKAGTVFGIMYNQRANPLYQKLRDLIMSGELGEIKRTNWIITSWYRSQAYYDSGGWRATWAGEGGGVLLNQDPHQLDLWQWTTGLMPQRVRAFCYAGKHRNIEVEDDVTAFVEYPNGATGIFVTTTGEAPGTNRFEVTGDRGKLVVENGQINFWRLRVPEGQFNRENTHIFGRPEVWKCEIPVVDDEKGGHAKITQNWVDAIRKGTPLLAPGEEGIKGLTISNAMHLSTWTDTWAQLPIDEDLFYAKLQEQIKQSTFTKTATESTTADLAGTFG